jgi:hypothetical protein
MSDDFMEEEDRELNELVFTELLQLNDMVSGLIAGLMGGFGIFFATNFLLLKGGENVGQHLGLLDQYFIGYSVTFTGSLVGLGYGFVTCFIIGYFVARLYNWIVGFKLQRLTERRQRELRARREAAASNGATAQVATGIGDGREDSDTPEGRAARKVSTGGVATP